MMKILNNIFDCCIIIILTNALPNVEGGWWFVLLILLFLLINIFPNFANRKLESRRLRILSSGVDLLSIFSFTTIINIAALLYGLFNFDFETRQYVWWAVAIFTFAFILFWSGMIRVYLTSKQLGVKWRILAMIFGWIPVVHIFILAKIIFISYREVKVENEKILLNNSRADKQICKTKYPILLVHGVFFRDSKFLNYWGRIPRELEKNGAKIYYGNQQSAASVEDCGRELAIRILQIVNETGCEKLNIIAHSKGGLDSRFALSMPEIKEHVASLTTINTPHRGCRFADYLLHKIPQKQIDIIAKKYNETLLNFGDLNPDFIKAVTDLTFENCTKFNEAITNQNGVFYQSVGSIMKHLSSGRFPLNFSYLLARHFDGKNDGLVGENSFEWGEKFQLLTCKGMRGISHGDMIDLNRENLPFFDVREFYVQLVSDLREKGF